MDPGRSCPVYRKILCATDLSPTGDRAVHLAYRLVADGGTVCLLHVYDPAWAIGGVQPYPPGEPPSFVQLKRAAERAASEHLHRLGFVSDRPDVTTDETIIHHPNPVAAIEDIARETGADAMVLGTHGRTGLGRLLMGSVATEILRRAKIPVILLHDPRVRDR